MDSDSIRTYCLSLPAVTEKIQWGNNLLLCIGGKMFAIMDLDVGNKVRISFKSTSENFAELIEHDGIIPAPYLAHAKWVALTRLNALDDADLKRYLRESYEMVRAKLSKKAREKMKV